VFPPDGDFLHYEDSGDGFIRGPGTGDIKGGLVMGLWAMAAIQQLCDDVDVQMIVSADEEKGSVSIRDWYLNGHIGADYAIGLEPGFPQGELSATVPLGVVYQRRGYGAIRFTVYGKDAHSGTSELGLNAAEAMAHRILKIQALNDPERGVSANVGTVNGGISANTVPGSVDGLVSFRFFEQAHGDQLLETIQNIIRDRYVYNEGLDLWDRAELTIETFNPPMEKSERNQLLIAIVLEEANRLGQNVVPIARGGGSDANFISAAGTPAICGMGAPAEGIHTAQERIYLPMLFERITLLTSTLYRLIQRNQ
jgi:glutamate carboxypeptidase